MVRFGLLGEDERELDFVLQLTTEKMLERRLQTKVCSTASVSVSVCEKGFIFCAKRVCLEALTRIVLPFSFLGMRYEWYECCASARFRQAVANIA